MVSFRLTKDEYDRLREPCFMRGIRSVSELARVGVSLLLQQPERPPQKSLQARVADLQARVHMPSPKLEHENQGVPNNGAAIESLPLSQAALAQ
jgi:hypothetical protein